MNKYFDDQINILKKEQDAIIKRNQPIIEDQLQDEINSGLWEGKSQDEINKEFQKRMNELLSPLESKYEKLNQDIELKKKELNKKLKTKTGKLKQDMDAYLNDLIKKAGDEKVENPDFDKSKEEGPDNRRLIPGNQIGEVLEKISTETDNAWKKIEKYL